MLHKEGGNPTPWGRRDYLRVLPIAHPTDHNGSPLRVVIIGLGLQTGVLPRLTTYFGPRTDAVGVTGANCRPGCNVISRHHDDSALLFDA
jgi:hypothetical protein